jgi:sugar phosphate isomerase/epimerase
MDPIHIHIPYARLKDFCEHIRLRRYDLEIYLSAAVLDQIEKTDLDGLCRSLDWKPSISLHAPFMDLNPGAVDPMIRSVTQMRFSRTLGVAAVLKPRVVVFHTGYDRWRYNGRTDIWLEYSVDTWTQVMETASKIGVRVAVENVFDEDPEALRLLIDRIALPDFGFCFDTGHFNLFSKVPMEQWFESLGQHLTEVHLHDNDGTGDAHLAVGKGTIDFEKFFRLMDRHGARPVYTIEAHEQDDVAISLDRVRELLSRSGRI